MIENNDIKVNIIIIEEDNNPNKNQIKTNNLLKELETRCKNVSVFNNKMANEINKRFRKKKVNPTVKYRGPLIITPNLYIDVCVYTKTSKVHIPSLKKYSLVSEFCITFLI